MRIDRYKGEIARIPELQWTSDYAADYADKSAAALRHRAASKARRRLVSKVEVGLVRQAELRLCEAFDELAEPGTSFDAFLLERVRLRDKDARTVARAMLETDMITARNLRLLGDRQAVAVRLRDGFRRDGVHYKGLVSAEHPILSLFVAKLPRAKNLFTGSNKTDYAPATVKLLALDDSYVNGNKQMRGFVRAELDATFSSWADFWRKLAGIGAPEPSIVVGRVAEDGTIVHPHLVYLLAESVNFGPSAHPKFCAKYDFVLRGLTAKLAPIGADAGGIVNCLRVKNPLCPLWNHQVGKEKPWSLAELARFVDTGAKLGAPSSAPLAAEHPDPAIVVQSNLYFSRLTGWTRDTVRLVRDGARADYAEWQGLVAAEALRLLATVGGDTGRGEKSALRLAQRTARWTWDNIRPVEMVTPEQKAIKAAESRKRAGKSKAAATLDTMLTAARAVLASGERLTRLAIAIRSGLADRTVRTHWDALQRQLQDSGKNRQVDPLVKKDTPCGTGQNNPASLKLPLAARRVTAPAFLSRSLAIGRPVLTVSPPRFLQPCSFSSPP